MADQRIEELLRQARQANKIDRERIELFEGLVRSPAWIAYVDVLEAKLQMLADQMLAPSGSMDGMIALEFIKGAMSGLVMARDIPSATIMAKPDIRPQPVTEDEDDDESV